MTLAPVLRRSLAPALALALGGCAFSPDYAWVDVHNHTDATLVARDATWPDHGGDRATVPPHAVRGLEVEVWWYDADIEVESGGRSLDYDLDIGPFEYWEDVHVRDTDFVPTGAG